MGFAGERSCVVHFNILIHFHFHHHIPNQWQLTNDPVHARQHPVGAHLLGGSNLLLDGNNNALREEKMNMMTTKWKEKAKKIMMKKRPLFVARQPR